MPPTTIPPLRLGVGCEVNLKNLLYEMFRFAQKRTYMQHPLQRRTSHRCVQPPMEGVLHEDFIQSPMEGSLNRGHMQHPLLAALQRGCTQTPMEGIWTGLTDIPIKRELALGCKMGLTWRLHSNPSEKGLAWGCTQLS